ncbi:MAG: magnesium transporter [Thiohalomonadaceae bacterium]
MTEATEQDKGTDRLQALRDALAEDRLSQAQELINEMYPAEIAVLLESLPGPERITVWELVSPELDGEVLTYVNDEVRASLIREMESHELVAATEGLDTDDLADLLAEMPDEVIQQILNTMDAQHRQRLEAVLSYPEDTAGGLMNVDTITVREDITLDVVLRYLRWHGEIPETTDSLMVVDREGKYLGLLSLTDLLTRNPHLSVAEVMIRDVEGINAATPVNEVATLFEHRDLISAPVVNDDGKLLGRITIDDVVDVIRDEADHSVLSMAGLSEEEDLFAPAVTTIRRRAVWLGINLLTALLASSVIDMFNTTIEQLVALAVLMPIVASMGGIAGSQTLTLVIRGMAQGRVGASNARRLLNKELAVGLLNGLLWAIIIAATAMLWFQNNGIGAVIGAAIIINLAAAAATGATLPHLLRRLGMDPALAGPVILTTVTDVVGFFSFLGLATVFLI